MNPPQQTAEELETEAVAEAAIWLFNKYETLLSEDTSPGGGRTLDTINKSILILTPNKAQIATSTMLHMAMQRIMSMKTPETGGQEPKTLTIDVLTKAFYAGHEYAGTLMSRDVFEQRFATFMSTLTPEELSRVV